MRLSRRGLQLALGVLWLLDGALQLQPVMFTSQFASRVISPVGVGQPAPLHWVVHIAVVIFHAHPVVFDAVFASVQLMLGVGLLSRRTARVALAGSIAWALGIWFVGEGLGGVLGSGATLLDGAPGAAVFYALLAVAAWERPDVRGRAPARILVLAWTTTFFGFAALELLLGARAGASTATGLTVNVAGLPSPLSSASRQMAAAALHTGVFVGIIIALSCVVIGILALRRGWTRTIGAVAGGLLGLGVWTFAEAFGGIATGLATDPNSGLLLVLFAFALWSVDERPNTTQGEAYRSPLLPLEQNTPAA